MSDTKKTIAERATENGAQPAISSHWSSGMSKRELFSLVLMHAYIVSGKLRPGDVAHLSIEMADAALLALESTKVKID